MSPQFPILRRCGVRESGGVEWSCVSGLGANSSFGANLPMIQEAWQMASELRRGRMGPAAMAVVF